MKKLYMFDLDGVLIDSKKNMNMSWDIVKLEHKVEPPSKTTSNMWANHSKLY